MITLKKLQIFKKYNGDPDGWLLLANENEKEAMNDGDWFQIKNFINDIRIIKKGLTSVEYAKNFEISLKNNSEDEKVMEYVHKLANEQEV